MKFTSIKLAQYIAILLIFLAGSFPALAKDTKSPTEKAAVVNGVVISQKELAKEMDFHLQRISRQGLQLSKEQMAELKNKVLGNLIDREILYQESQKSGIKVDKNKIDEELSVIKKRFPSMDEYKKALSTMKISEDEIKNQIKKKLAINALVDMKIAQKIVVTDKETKTYYDANPDLFKQPEQVRASHILIKVEAGADQQKKAQAMQKIKEIQQKLKDGQDFAALAKKYSEDKGSSANGGDLGFFARGQMVKPFEDAAFAMKPNEVSDIVETQFGYHLIKVYRQKPGKILVYAEVKDLLTERMRQEKTQQEATKYIAELKKDAKIKRYL
ncbi:MAG: peptidylprolyl isomerase [Desulfobacterales bacterium]